MNEPVPAESARTRPPPFALVVALPAALGAVLLAIATRAGVLLDSDSAGYLQTARAVDRAPGWFPRGIATDASLHPPGYPWLLALWSRSGGELAASRWIAVASVALALASVALLVRRHCSTATTLAAVIGTLVTRSFLLRLGAFAMSDLLAMAVALAAMAAFDAGRRIGGRRGVAAQVGGAALAGLCPLIRVDGLAVVATLAIVAYLGAGPRRVRAASAAGVVVIGVLPALPWTIDRFVVFDLPRSPTGVRWFGLRFDNLLDPARELGYNILSGPVMSAVGPVVTVLGTAGIVAAAVWSLVFLRRVRGTAPGSADDTTRLLVVFGWTFTAGIVLTRLIFDPYVVFDLRHLTPSWTAALMVMAIRFDRRAVGGVRDRNAGLGRRVVVIAAVGSILCGTAVTVRSVAHPTTSSFDLRTWYADSETLGAVRRLPKDLVLYSNHPDLTMLLADHDAYSMPVPVVPATGEPTPGYAAAMAAMTRSVRLDGAVVVVFQEDDADSTDPLAELLATSGLVVIERFADGALVACGRACG